MDNLCPNANVYYFYGFYFYWQLLRGFTVLIVLFSGYLLDPHTAVAKTVGDRVKQEDRPMVISSTAHCDKFAPEIMSFLDRSKRKDDLTSMFKMLQNLRSQPLPHLLLEESMGYKRIHNTVVNADYKNVVEQILTFSRNV